MFNKEKLKELEKRFEKKKKYVKDLEREIEDRIKKVDYQEELFENRLSLEKSLIKQKVLDKTRYLKDEVTILEIEKNALQAENDILNKAFKNLGFEVKDMKDILNKLVDGVVSKNQLQVIK